MEPDWLSVKAIRQDFRNMISKDGVSLVRAEADIADLKTKQRLHAGKINDKLSVTVQLHKEFDHMAHAKPNNFRNMIDKNKVSLDRATAAIGEDNVAKFAMIQKYLDAGRVEAAEYLLGRELNDEEMKTGKLKIDKQTYFPKPSKESKLNYSASTQTSHLPPNMVSASTQAQLNRIVRDLQEESDIEYDENNDVRGHAHNYRGYTFSRPAFAYGSRPDSDDESVHSISLMGSMADQMELLKQRNQSQREKG